MNIYDREFMILNEKKYELIIYNCIDENDTLLL
jgi:hypothetical protein